MELKLYRSLAENVQINVGNKEFNIARIKKIDLLFEELIKQSPDDINVVDERMPYWADLWPSAIGMAEFLVANQELIRGKKLIEIGCGLGLPGIVAGRLGADVLMTDYLQPALDFAQYNWELNLKSEFRSQLLDWRDIDHMKPFDVILASDVAYESRSFDTLIKVIKRLTISGGVFILSEPNRKFASPFITLVKKHFSVDAIDLPVKLDGISYKISIYTIFVP
jgi:predicted nicotinamide N-methyase